MLALASAGALGAACGEAQDASTQDAGTNPEAGPNWQGTDCHQCYAARCEATLTECTYDPSCAAFKDCADACPSGPDGGPELQCVDACRTRAQGQDVAGCLAESLEVCSACGGASDAGPDASACGHPLLCQECGPSDDPDPCHQCQDENCCESDQACRDDPGCLDYFNCVQACTADTLRECELECDEKVGAENFLKFNMKLSCVLHYCREPSKCGVEPLTTCDECFIEQCGAEVAACDSDPWCGRIGGCIAFCNDQACYDACYSQYAPGVPLFNASTECLLAECFNPCSDV
ncbi:MAG: hypothetical protein H6718_32125 [Polyangiaceae bacterium]|nr:hypothetical protein [Myxococcales bacterium]MCB9590106.1 hypothetical protein [Polyangiaceae bacterium]MCB9607985.1 hypothetical protein [Polyangiaceae bacterium]